MAALAEYEVGSVSSDGRVETDHYLLLTLIINNVFALILLGKFL